jgi:hypothetical protein
VEAGVRIVTDVLLALVSGGVFGLLGGYVCGVLRTLNERRDAALAEIFKEMSLFYRSIVSGTDDPNADPNKPTPESSGIPVKTHVNDQFGKFARTFFDNAATNDAVRRPPREVRAGSTSTCCSHRP